MIGRQALFISIMLVAASATGVAGTATANGKGDPMQLRARVGQALDRWCRWLSEYAYQVPGTDLYTLNPTMGTGRGPYRDVAGNAFAAAAAGYWLHRHDVDAKTAAPLRGLIKLSLGTHVAVKTVDRPDCSKWGATQSFADDWHADLFAAAQGMLMLPHGVKGEFRDQVAAIVKWEADKQVEFGIDKKRRTWPGRWPDTSCGESNSWSAALLQVARAVLPETDRDAAWRESSIQYSLNAICMPADMTSDEIVGGKPVKDRVKGANFEPGGIQEHHGFYHPGYMGWPLAYQAIAQVCDQQLPEERRNPDVYLHNWKKAFDRLKQSTFHNGRFIHCAGDDWITYGYGNTQFFLACVFAAVHFGDADAARMADEWLKLVEAQQDLGHGSVLAARLGTFQRLRVNDFSWYEAQEGCVLAQALWMLERLDTARMAAPASPEEYNKRNQGTYIEPYAQLAWTRNGHRFASASWRSAFTCWQFIVQPVDLPHLLKFNYNGLGLLDLGAVNEQHEIKWHKMDAFEGGGFWSTGQIDRLNKSITYSKPAFPLVRQYQAIAALPEGPTVLVDWCQAADQIWIAREGGLGLHLAADIFNDSAVRLTIDGHEKTFGQAPCRDVWHDLGARSVTVEKKMTIQALAGEGTFQLLQKRGRSPERNEQLDSRDHHGEEESLVAHELYFGPPAYDRPRIVSPNEWFRKQVIVFYCDPASTPARVAGSVEGGFPCLTVKLPDVGRMVLVNFDTKERKIDMPGGGIVVPAQAVAIGKMARGQ